MNDDIEKMVKNVPTCLKFQATQLNNKTMSHKIPWRLWESIRADTFPINDKHYLCIVDCHSKFPVVKQVEGNSADNLVKKCNISIGCPVK